MDIALIWRQKLKHYLKASIVRVLGLCSLDCWDGLAGAIIFYCFTQGSLEDSSVHSANKGSKFLKESLFSGMLTEKVNKVADHLQNKLCWQKYMYVFPLQMFLFEVNGFLRLDRMSIPCIGLVKEQYCSFIIFIYLYLLNVHVPLP